MLASESRENDDEVVDYRGSPVVASVHANVSTATAPKPKISIATARVMALKLAPGKIRLCCNGPKADLSGECLQWVEKRA